MQKATRRVAFRKRFSDGEWSGPTPVRAWARSRTSPTGNSADGIFGEDGPIITASWVVEALSTTKPTAGRAIGALEATGVLVETTGKKRDRVYAYQAYLDRLRAGTELGSRPRPPAAQTKIKD